MGNVKNSIDTSNAYVLSILEFFFETNIRYTTVHPLIPFEHVWECPHLLP